MRILKRDVAELKIRMDRLCVVVEEMNEKLTLALELLQHCVSLIPSVHKHDLQIKGTKSEIDVTQSPENGAGRVSVIYSGSTPQVGQ